MNTEEYHAIDEVLNRAGMMHLRQALAEDQGRFTDPSAPLMVVGGVRHGTKVAFAGRVMRCTDGPREISGIVRTSSYELYQVGVGRSNGRLQMTVYKHESLSDDTANRAAVALFFADLMLLMGRGGNPQ